MQTPCQIIIGRFVSHSSLSNSLQLESLQRLTASRHPQNCETGRINAKPTAKLRKGSRQSRR